jgi:hypothetical protein
VKQYAALLNVDEATLAPHVEAITASAEPLPLPGADPRYDVRARTTPFANDDPPVRPLDPIVEDGNRRYFPDRRIGLSLAGLAGVLLLCSGFYAWWNKAPQAASASAAQQTAPITQVKTAKSEGAPSGAPTVDVTTTTEPDGHVVLNLSATEETWLSITSDGKQIFSGVLQPSQTKTLTGLEVAKMKVGNAGGIAVRWNGKEIGPIGPRGQVRVVLFTPENFQILEPSQTL